MDTRDKLAELQNTVVTLYGDLNFSGSMFRITTGVLVATASNILPWSVGEVRIKDEQVVIVDTDNGDIYLSL